MKRILFLVLGLSLATAVHAQTFTITELFGFSCPNGLCPDGSQPTALIQASDANFYGVDSQTVYKITARARSLRSTHFSKTRRVVYMIKAIAPLPW